MQNDKLAEECRNEAERLKQQHHKGYGKAQDLLKAAADEIERLKQFIWIKTGDVDP